MGQATLAWQSDYTQFDLVDPGDGDVAAPVEITAEVKARSLFVPPSGLVVYTNNCKADTSEDWRARRDSNS